MKVISKLFVLAAATMALASCSDDLTSGAKYAANKASVNAELEQPGDGSFTRMGINDATSKVVWTTGDELRVFTLEKLTYNTYNLIDGAGSTSGDFESSDTHDLVGIKYAITEAGMVYGVSAYEETQARLTMTLTPSYDVDEEMLEGGIHNFPIPMWGKTIETPIGDDKYEVQSTLCSLISYLRIDVKNLPVDTKAIVLTTHGHGDGDNGAGIDGFFQLWNESPGFTNYNQWYNAYEEKTNAIYGGNSEALSGTLNCLLEKDTYLQVDKESRLVPFDTLRVNIAPIVGIEDEYGRIHYENSDQVIYMPVLVNTYKDLHVIAVTEDSPLSYQWVGQEIASYQDEEFKRNGVHYVDLQNIVLEDRDYTAAELSWIIKNSIDPTNLFRTSVIEVPSFISDGTPIVIDREDKGNNVQLIFDKISGDAEVITIEEGKVNGYSVASGTYTYTTTEIISLIPFRTRTTEVEMVTTEQIPVLDYILPTEQKVGEAKREVGIVLPASTGNETAYNWNVLLPTSNVAIGAIDGMNKNDNFTVLAANTKEVSGRDLTENDGDKLNNYKNASVIVTCGLNSLIIAPGSEGDVYCYWGGAEEPEIINFALLSTNSVSIRLTDFLVKYLGQVNNRSAKRAVYTTGSSAIQNFELIKDGSDVTIEDSWTGTEIALNDSYKENMIPRNSGIYAYWTGAALTENAIELGYDCGKVYTAAQLASVGEVETAEYVIPNQAVYEMWLGGPDYPWMGAQVVVEDFKLRGRGVSLQNMELETNDRNFVDPHHCCTSCGPVRKITVEDNLGLIRSIINESTAEVDSVNLNDVYLKTDARIDNIGSLVGYVETGNAIFESNQIGEIKIDVNGENIGGMVGNSQVSQLNAKNNITTGYNKGAGYIISKLDSVGGQFGNIVASDAVLIESSTVGYAFNVSSIKGGYVGGIAGNILETGSGNVAIKSSTVTIGDKVSGNQQFIGGLAGIITSEKEGDVIFDSNTVTVENDIESEENGNVGGGSGKIVTNSGDITVDKNKITAKNIEANGASYAAGLVAELESESGNSDFDDNSVTADTIYTVDQFAGGWIGISNLMGDNAKLLIDRDNAASDSKVTVNKFIEATEGYAGGLIGEAEDGETFIGRKAKDDEMKVQETLTITVAELRAAYAGAGIVGDNEIDTHVWTGSSDKAYFKTDVKLTKFTNTKANIWEEYFPYNSDKHLLGSFGNVVGYMDGVVDVYKDKLTINKANLNKDAKVALIYKNNPNRHHTTDGYAYYWGDSNYYVGWGNTGSYTIDGGKVTEGDQNDTKGYNLYKTNDDYED